MYILVATFHSNSLPLWLNGGNPASSHIPSHRRISVVHTMYCRWYKKLYYETYPEEKKEKHWVEDDPKKKREKEDGEEDEEEEEGEAEVEVEEEEGEEGDGE